MSLKIKVLLITLFVMTLSWSVQAQLFSSDENTPKFNSPYSRVGIGDLASQNFIASYSLGGLSAAFNDPYQANITNPAAIGFLKSTSFEVGGFFRYGLLNNDDVTINTFAGNFGYMSIGFPMINEVNLELDRKDPLLDWRMNFALVPYTNVGYNVQVEGPVEGGQVDGIETDSTTSTFTGKGGTYKLIWTNALKYKDLSVGINAGYLFGNIINEREVFINGSFNSYFNNLVDNTNYTGLIWSFGAQYKHQFKKMSDKGKLENSGRSLTIGAYVNSQGNIKSTSDQFYRRINPTFQIADTLRNVSGIEGSAVLPGQFGVGLMYEKVNKFRVGLDYSASQWSNYTNDVIPSTLVNSWRVALGGEILPNYNSYNNYLDKVRYRLGLYYENDPRLDEFNEQLTTLGLVLGVGMPITLPRGQTSFFNLGLEVGQIGTEQSLNETYFRVNLGFTLNDNYWFFKRKFD